jgi:hypothetical protein
MAYQKHFFFALALFLPFYLPAQTDSIPRQSFSYSFLGQGGINPGATFTYERVLLSNQQFQLLTAAKAGMYFHFRNNDGFFFMIQSGTRYRLTKRLFAEHFLGIGYLQSFLNGGDAYYVNASGQIIKAHKWGNPHFMPSISFGLSYQINQRIRLHVRPMIYWQIPFNKSILVQYAFEAGLSVGLKKHTRE